MTVGEAFGDSGGDLTTPPPAKVQQERADCGLPKQPLGGRFWVLQSSDDEEDGDADELSSAGGSAFGKYLCRTPLSVSGRDMSERSSELARRMRKRINWQASQRMAVMEITASEGTLSSPSMLFGRALCKAKIKAMHVLQPTVFMDDGLDGWTVVCRRRWSPANERKSPDPFFPGISNFVDVGSARRRAGAQLNKARWGPKNVLRKKPLAKIDVVFDENIFPFASHNPNDGRRFREEILLFPPHNSYLESNDMGVHTNNHYLQICHPVHLRLLWMNHLQVLLKNLDKILKKKLQTAHQMMNHSRRIGLRQQQSRARSWSRICVGIKTGRLHQQQ
jgi:hypothetical protein